ncbi:MAG: hypothetical protein LUG51_07160 [Tannerellaceae bacterium]|nr:hypothetical protein [Tannerellaceae bacterium]
MEKKYNHGPENPEYGKVSEPVIAYGKDQVVIVLYQYTIHELRKILTGQSNRWKQDKYYPAKN